MVAVGMTHGVALWEMLVRDMAQEMYPALMAARATPWMVSGSGMGCAGMAVC